MNAREDARRIYNKLKPNVPQSDWIISGGRKRVQRVLLWLNYYGADGKYNPSSRHWTFIKRRSMGGTIKNPPYLSKRKKKALKIALAVAYSIWRKNKKYGFARKRKLPKLVQRYLKPILKANKITNPVGKYSGEFWEPRTRKEWMDSRARLIKALRAANTMRDYAAWNRLRKSLGDVHHFLKTKTYT